MLGSSITMIAHWPGVFYDNTLIRGIHGITIILSSTPESENQEKEVPPKSYLGSRDVRSHAFTYVSGI